MSTFKALKVGDTLSELSFYKVEKVVGNQVQLQVDGGESIVMDSGYVDSFLQSGDQFDKEEKISKTEMSEILLAHPRTALTISFNKQVDPASVVKEIEDVYQNTAPNKISGEIKKTVTRALVGEERILVGRFHGGQDEFGRINAVDMNIEKDKSKSYDNRLRKIDPRTLNWLIVNRVKYSLKK